MEFENHNHASIFFCQRTVSYLDFRKKNPLVLGLYKKNRKVKINKNVIFEF